MKLLPDLNGHLDDCKVHLYCPFSFSESATHIAYKVDTKNRKLERLSVNLDIYDQPIIWSLDKAMHEDIEKIFEKHVNNFIKTERLTKTQEIHKIRSYVQDLLNNPKFEPLRELEEIYELVIKERMRDAAVQFVNEHMSYNMPHIQSQGDRQYVFDEPIYYHRSTRSLTVLQPDGACLPIGRVKLIFTADEPTN